MTEIIAGILVLISCCLIGGGIGNVYAARVKFLKEFIDFINFSEGEINFYKSEISEIIRKFISDKQSDFSDFLRNDCEIKIPAIKNEDIIAVKEYVDGLKKLDLESQRSFNVVSLERAKKSLKTAEDEEVNKGKLTKKLMPLVGVALFIIIV